MSTQWSLCGDTPPPVISPGVAQDGQAIAGSWFLLDWDAKTFHLSLIKKDIFRNFCSGDFMWLQTQGDPFKGLGKVFLLVRGVSFMPSVQVLAEAILRIRWKIL
jgi:hypothetical protein